MVNFSWSHRGPYIRTVFYCTTFLPSNLADVRVQAQPRRLHLDGRVGRRGRRGQPQGVRPDVPPEELK